MKHEFTNAGYKFGLHLQSNLKTKKSFSDPVELLIIIQDNNANPKLSSELRSTLRTKREIISFLDLQDEEYTLHGQLDLIQKIRCFISITVGETQEILDDIEWFRLFTKFRTSINFVLLWQEIYKSGFFEFLPNTIIQVYV